MCVTNHQAALACALSEEGLSQRQIAAKTGVSRGTVQRIQKGLWKPAKGPHEPEPSPFVGLKTVCPHCRRRVIMPCLACAVESQPDKRKFGADPPAIDLGLHLSADQAARLEGLRRSQRRGLIF